VAAVRSLQQQADAAATARIFAQVRSQLDSSDRFARAGQGSEASTAAFDAYMTFEQVERSVRAKNPDLAASLETRFAELRTRAAGGATPVELDGIRAALAADLENAERVLGETLSPLNLFVQSFVILVREGLEAILVLGALMAFLVKTGAAQRKRDLHIGVGAAVAASLLTAFALETVFRLSPAKREALEGLTMVIATVVLFYVSYWLLSKMEVAKWNRFVRGKVQDAVTSGSALALASAAFLAVYREGFETVLFYKALFVAGGSGSSTAAVVAGILLGSAVMVAVYLAINRFGVRLPLKPFFGVTSAFLYYMAFVFAGKGVAELQEGQLVPTTIVSWAPRIPGLGIYPTAESLLAQSVLLVLLVAALVWTFVVEPRRLRVTSVMVPESGASAGGQASRAPGLQSVTVGTRLELLRSLERMEADLAEMRSEVERMRAHLRAKESEGIRRHSE
jgi:high-affinity iron transporter